MAKMKLDPLFVKLSGIMGEFVFKKSKRGEAIVSRRPRKSNTRPSEAQKANRERFKLAIAYARAAIANAAQSSGSPRSEAEWDGRPGRSGCLRRNSGERGQRRVFRSTVRLLQQQIFALQRISFSLAAEICFPLT